MRNVRLVFILLGLMIPNLLLAIQPHAGDYFHTDTDGKNFKMTLVAKGKNFQFHGKSTISEWTGTLYGSTGKIRGTLKELNGQHRELKVNGYWNYAQGSIDLAIPETKAMVIFSPKNATYVAAKSFTGTWKSDFGTLTLTQSGKHVSGKYDYYSGEVVGDIRADGTLYFKWTQKNPDKHGNGFFKLSSDGNTFSGGWDYTNASGAPLNNGGGWSGRRIK